MQKQRAALQEEQSAGASQSSCCLLLGDPAVIRLTNQRTVGARRRRGLDLPSDMADHDGGLSGVRLEPQMDAPGAWREPGVQVETPANPVKVDEPAELFALLVLRRHLRTPGGDWFTIWPPIRRRGFELREAFSNLTQSSTARCHGGQLALNAWEETQMRIKHLAILPEVNATEGPRQRQLAHESLMRIDVRGGRGVTCSYLAATLDNLALRILLKPDSLALDFRAIPRVLLKADRQLPIRCGKPEPERYLARVLILLAMLFEPHTRCRR